MGKLPSCSTKSPLNPGNGGGGLPAAAHGSLLPCPHPNEFNPKPPKTLCRPQVAAVEAALLQRLMGDWGLPAELERARNLFTLATGALEPFAARLMSRLDAGERVAALSAFDLQLSLQHSFPAASPAELLPPADALSGAAHSGVSVWG